MPGYSLPMKRENPFPGMNPWLQMFWRDVHASLLTYYRDALNDQLPEGMHARIDERLAISHDEHEFDSSLYIPDVSITQSWDRPASPHLAGVVVAEPRLVESKDDYDTFVEIVEGREHVITAIELLSPSNKQTPETREKWQRKRRDYLRSGISVVEIDLIRGGWVLPGREKLPKPLPPNRVTYGACITRNQNKRYHEIYDLPLREALPVLSIPLREEDQDATLDLQALINQCYVRGRYSESIHYALPLEPALPPEEQTWATELLKQAGLL